MAEVLEFINYFLLVGIFVFAVFGNNKKEEEDI